MSLNQYIQVGRLVNSCLIGANAYRVLSREEEFEASLVEEFTDKIRQRPGYSYMRVAPTLDNTEFWMVPFIMADDKFARLQATVEHIQRYLLGRENLYFPFDLVQEQSQIAYLIRPINRQQTLPIRKFMPDSQCRRWDIAADLFRRVNELKKFGLTSNGISREQIRVSPDTGKVSLWLNHTVSLVEGSEIQRDILRHEGFLTIPKATEDRCKKLNIPITGTQRDVYSAAVAAFYLILYTHPFIGSGFYDLLREEYMINYHHFPMYIMMGNSTNDLGNQMFGRVIDDQWKRTIPYLKKLFDSIFMAVTDPETYWKSDDPCWDPNMWIDVLEMDAMQNDNERSRSDFHFVNEQYHQV